MRRESLVSSSLNLPAWQCPASVAIALLRTPSHALARGAPACAFLPTRSVTRSSMPFTHVSTRAVRMVTMCTFMLVAISRASLMNCWTLDGGRRLWRFSCVLLRYPMALPAFTLCKVVKVLARRWRKVRHWAVSGWLAAPGILSRSACIEFRSLPKTARKLTSEEGVGEGSLSIRRSSVSAP